MMFYPIARRVAASRGLPFNAQGFAEVLKPLRGVDWRDPRMEDIFESSGEQSAFWLKDWMEMAVLNNEIFSHEDINSNDRTLVTHGRALYAYPSRPHFEISQGLIQTTFILNWEHGNVFKSPKAVLLTVVDEEGEEHHITPGGDWTWTYPEGDDMQPKVAQFVIAVNNNEIDGQRWRLAVTVVNQAENSNIHGIQMIWPRMLKMINMDFLDQLELSQSR